MIRSPTSAVPTSSVSIDDAPKVRCTEADMNTRWSDSGRRPEDCCGCLSQGAHRKEECGCWSDQLERALDCLGRVHGHAWPRPLSGIWIGEHGHERTTIEFIVVAVAVIIFISFLTLLFDQIKSKGAECVWMTTGSFNHVVVWRVFTWLSFLPPPHNYHHHQIWYIKDPSKRLRHIYR
jgi:hypothetical protein